LVGGFFCGSESILIVLLGKMKKSLFGETEEEQYKGYE